ncbi:MAG: NUDIX domain-containing protein [Alphaproteobacteria bacterium]|jgi:8-oxo-dGTP diphosphatase|nr:NUDIX domain-containing protein [Alphaproteobacteria bacterium]MBT5390602.1 NUDIX domain-containing protein [Alphaproteobacteria bacterium]MBT5540342.1 NUDIX domain-containing protein [Alphaproteobacteria bacterium]MBT5654256.1 NUDIX domain-containing protein [Alphaproteobacteria bacterium]
MSSIRTSVKGIIIRDDKLLCVQYDRGNGLYFALPGGGQEPGETLHEALKRECLEEIGCAVSVGELSFIRDYLADNHEFAHQNPNFQQVEFMFQCTLSDNAEPNYDLKGDMYQIGVQWLDLKFLSDKPIYPKMLKEVVNSNRPAPIYLGDVN